MLGVIQGLNDGAEPDINKESEINRQYCLKRYPSDRATMNVLTFVHIASNCSNYERQDGHDFTVVLK